MTIGDKIINIKDKLKERDIRRNIKQHIETNRTKEMAKLLIDYCEGDFAIVFNKKSADSLVNGMTHDFLVAMTDIEKRDHNHPDFFFRNFGCSRGYFDLKGDK